MFEQTHAAIKQIKKEKPLILNITNFVTMDFIANGLLSLGASPIMSQAEHEIEDLLKISKSVVINPGTVNDEFISLCKQTCFAANALGIPIILDPVGAGASQYRTDICTILMSEFDIAIIRGNASEIMALAGCTQKTQGVDSIIDSAYALESAKLLSKQCNSAIVVSGKIDILVDSNLQTVLECGSSLMPTITGTGCLLTAVIAAFHAIEKNRFAAAKMAALFYGICGEVAEKKSQGPGSFKTQFLDTLSFLPEREHYDKH